MNTLLAVGGFQFDFTPIFAALSLVFLALGIRNVLRQANQNKRDAIADMPDD